MTGPAATATADDRRWFSDPDWDEIARRAPQLTATLRRYVIELQRSTTPGAVDTVDRVLRQFAGHVTEIDPRCRKTAGIRRAHIEEYLSWAAARRSERRGPRMSTATLRRRLALISKCFSDLADWADPDAPRSGLIMATDFPAPPPQRRPPRPQRTRPPRPPKPRPLKGPSRVPVPEVSWPRVDTAAPAMAATMRRYLEQLTISARPSTVAATDLALRLFAGHLIDTDPTCRCVAAIERRHIESFKLALGRRPGRRPGSRLSPTTIRHRLGLLRTFFERVIEFGYDDAPARVPIFNEDLPRLDEPLPKFLDDPTAARFMAALAEDPNRRRRLMVELLARTGMRAGELAALDHDAMVRIGDRHWLRIPVGKLHNDRYVPLHPLLVELISDYRQHQGPNPSGRLVERDDGQPFDRRTIARYVDTIAHRAGVGHVHPHQLRHTLATQAVNRGMSLEAIAALLGHRSMDMTLTYARISDRTVADEYFRVTQAAEAAYDKTRPLPAHLEGKNMKRLAAEAHRRLLGNGYCTRPVGVDCIHETICEQCGFFETGPQFVTLLKRQRNDAAKRGDPTKATLFDDLIHTIDTPA
jgi:site-specific recombinase XerD